MGFSRSTTLRRASGIGAMASIKEEMKKMHITFSLWNALKLSVMSNNDGYVKLLISEGADIHRENDFCLSYAVDNDQYNIAFILLNNGADLHIRNDSLIRTAAARNYVDITRLLLVFGADIHIDNDSIIKSAIRGGRVDIVELALDQGNVPESVIKEGLYYVQGEDRKYKDIFKEIKNLLLSYQNKSWGSIDQRH